MNWTLEAEQLYQKIVDRVPAPHTQLVATTLREGAEDCASRAGRPAVSEPELIAGFFASTPKPLHPQVKANLGSLGVDYERYVSQAEAQPHPTLGVDTLLRDFETMCRGLGVPCNRGKVEAAIQAFAQPFGRSSVSMRTTTKSLEHRDLAVRFLDVANVIEPDPLTTALQRHLMQDSGHPIYSLFFQAQERCRAFGYGVDIEAEAGFSKIWMAPSSGSDSIATLCSLPGLPAAVTPTVPHFERHGLETFGLMGFDFNHGTINVYFMIRGSTGPEHGYGHLLQDLGFASAPLEVVSACRPASVMYYSFSWKGDQPRRVCFNVVCENRAQVPVHFHPRFGECLNDQAFLNGQPRLIYGVALSSRDHYFKVENDYNGTMATQLIDCSEAGKVGVSPR